MREDTPAGGAAVPAPVEIGVSDTDLDIVRADFRRRRLGFRQPGLLVVGILLLVLGVLRLRSHGTGLELWSLYCGIVYIAGALFFMWRPPKNVPAFLPSRELQFSETGLGIRFIYGSARLNHYGWWRIKAIDDLGELFVLVPLFGSRIVFPKRDFPDGGREAWAFFSQHGGAGRTTSVTAGPV